MVVTGAPNPSVAYLAQGQDLHGKMLFKPACNGFGCALSGDSTSFLSKMTWQTWLDTEAVGTGTDSSTAATRIAPPGRSTRSPPWSR